MERQHISHFALLEQVGENHFATTYRARNTDTDREVTLRILHDSFAPDAEAAQRLLAEIEPLTRLRHPQIEQIEEVVYAEGRLCIATELLHAPDLAQHIHKSTRIRWADMLALLEPLCAALDYMHAQGGVHGNLTPTNVLIDSERGPLLTGMALAFAVANTNRSDHMHGDPISNPNYAAPERWQGHPSTPATDVYALGCIVYEMLSGEQLFHAHNTEQLREAHAHGPHFPTTWPEKLADEVEVIVRKALARDPAARYHNASALWHALNDFALATVEENEQLPPVSALWSRTLPILTWLLVIIAVVGVVWVVAGLGTASDGAAVLPSTAIVLGVSAL